MDIFKKVSKDIYLCKECFNFEIYCGVGNEQEMMIHVYHRHHHFWNVSMHPPSSLSQHVWPKLFDFYAESSIIKCKHCTMLFDIDVQVELLYDHIRMEHEIVILGFSLINL